MFELAVVASIVSGALCGVLGYYVEKFKITTLSFSVAHAALAGAALALVLGLDATYLALVFAVVFALIMGVLSPRLAHERELVSMGFFSLFNALAIFMIYLSNVYVLSSASIAVVLWGSILAVTKPKLIVLLGSAALFLTYLAFFKHQIDAILFDKKLAEAEGVDVYFHTIVLLLFVGTTIALTLKLTGGFLVFALLYNPVASSIRLARSAKRQLILSPVLGACFALLGLAVSYVFDWPVGATIALVSSLSLFLSHLARATANKMLLLKVARMGAENREKSKSKSE